MSRPFFIWRVRDATRWLPVCLLTSSPSKPVQFVACLYEQCCVLLKRIMVHKTCGYGDCRSDSRKENLDNVTFVSFPRDTGKNHEKCLRWITLSGRIDLTPERVNRYTYVCSKHFVGGNGPTDEYPDPVQFPGKISRIPRGIHGNMRVAPHHAIQKAAKKAKTFTVTSAAQLNNVQNANYFNLVKQEPGFSDFTSGQQGSDATRNQTKSIKLVVRQSWCLMGTMKP